MNGSTLDPQQIMYPQMGSRYALESDIEIQLVACHGVPPYECGGSVFHQARTTGKGDWTHSYFDVHGMEKDLGTYHHFDSVA